MFTAKNIVIIGLGLATAAFATKYEAESATLTDDAKNVNSTETSGTGYVNMQGGNINFENVTVEAAGKYQVTIHYKAAEYKANYLVVNGETAATVDFNITEGWGDVSAVANFKAGANTVSIEHFWGWISVDYIDIEPYQSSPFQLSGTPVTPGATGSAIKLYSFLRENFGKRTISGIMTGDMEGYTIGEDFKTHEDIQYIYKRTGKFPALVGVDFLFATGPKASESWYTSVTEKGVEIAKELWKAGGIPAFTWHWKDPLDQDDAFYIQGADNGQGFTTFDFKTAFKEGTTEWDTESAAYKGIIDDIDHIADYFLDLQKDSIAAIFRPLHEAGGKWFWWSINSGEEFAALYRLVYDRMVNVKGVKNLIWVYNPEGSSVTGWDPGSEYYDVISIDIYNNDNDHSSNSGAFEKYKTASESKKIIALSENGPIPDVANMHNDEAVWSWWMPWYSTWGGKWPGQTSDAVWKTNMEDERIISLEDMPGWDKYTPGSEPTTRLATAPRLQGKRVHMGFFDMKGQFMGMSVQGLPQGRYIMRSKVQGHTENRLYIKK